WLVSDPEVREVQLVADLQKLRGAALHSSSHSHRLQRIRSWRNRNRGRCCRRTKSYPLRYLALLRVRGECEGFTDCLDGSKVVVGSTWRLNLNNPSVRTTKHPRVQRELFEFSNRFQTVSNTNEVNFLHPTRLLRGLD